MKKRILYIEDDLDTFFVVNSILQEAGYEIFKEHDISCLPSLGTMQPDLILLDYYLGISRGDAICSALKNDPLTGSCKIILFSVVPGLGEIA